MLAAMALLSAIPSGMAQNVDNIKLTASLDSTHIIIGDQTLLHIRAEGVGKSHIVFPSLAELTQGPIEALDFSMDTTIKGGSISQIEQIVVVTSFDTGKHLIDNIAVKVVNGRDSIIMTISDSSLILSVDYLSSADTNKCEVKADIGNISEPFTFWEIFRWVLLGLLVVAIIVGLWWVVSRRKADKPIIVMPKSKPVSPDRRALADLEALRRKELWQKGRIKKYYTDMTDIVRRFLHNMYGMPAGEMTTRQTLRAFHNISDWSEESESLLRRLLQSADMVKFAKSQPADYEHDQAMQYAIDFVRLVAETHKINNPENEGNK